MKKTLRKHAGLFCLAIILLPVLSACTSDPDWWDYPGDNWGYSDPRLVGSWELVQYNSDPVPAGATNYLTFDGNGYGYYTYYDNGYLERERLRYWCQGAVSGGSNYQINIQYEYHNPLTTNYWFTHGNNTLWMQWQTGGGRVQTYVYDRINSAPW